MKKDKNCSDKNKYACIGHPKPSEKLKKIIDVAFRDAYGEINE